ncbi:MAG: alkaline phosphatase family protein [Bacteroidetes bacterium]|nr:alkaline phosphatase family protein [Bacteroidota bacterium]
MKKLLLPLVILISFVFTVHAQTPKTATLQRPKLVVGIVVDQMRWDYLYRYYDKYTNDGFKRLLNNGYRCENTMINYLPSYTAVGHSTIFTGSVPAIDGIAGNDWTEQLTGQRVYCTDDSTVQPVGAAKATDGKMSPRNLLVSTITDELRLATNFQSRVVGVSLKDRASILPAGHLASAAYWLDDASGNFITSTYYAQDLPDWVKAYNAKNKVSEYINKGWNSLYPLNTYKESDPDAEPYEGLFTGETSSVFPHDLKAAYAKSKGAFRSTPYGNSLTLDFATQAVEEYKLGHGTATDFLTINCASTDYVGHMFGPNSIEIEDTYLRLDKDLSAFFTMLDAKVGKGQWLVFLTADHGAAHAIDFMKDHKLPADFWYIKPLVESLNKALNEKFNNPALVKTISNYQVDFDWNKIAAANLDADAVKKATVDFLKKQPGILFAVDMAHVGDAPVPEPIKMMITNGYNYKRSGAIQIVLDAGWFEGYSKTGTTHGTWNPYDTHIPLLWYGWGITPGHTNRTTYMTDISATVAALLHIQMPNGCIGHVITEVVK